jgi:phage baseplate assembly protein W
MNQKYVAESAIALPFAIDSYGNITKTNNQSKIWADKVRSVIGTLQKERVMRPSFGSRIPQSAFEGSQIALQDIESAIRDAFVAYLPLLELESINLTSDDQQSVITAEVTYILPNQEKVSTSVGAITVSGNKIPYEELP